MEIAKMWKFCSERPKDIEVWLFVNQAFWKLEPFKNWFSTYVQIYTINGHKNIKKYKIEVRFLGQFDESNKYLYNIYRKTKSAQL